MFLRLENLNCGWFVVAKKSEVQKGVLAEKVWGPLVYSDFFYVDRYVLHVWRQVSTESRTLKRLLYSALRKKLDLDLVQCANLLSP